MRLLIYPDSYESPHRSLQSLKSQKNSKTIAAVIREGASRVSGLLQPRPTAAFPSLRPHSLQPLCFFSWAVVSSLISSSFNTRHNIVTWTPLMPALCPQAPRLDAPCCPSEVGTAPPPRSSKCSEPACAPNIQAGSTGGPVLLWRRHASSEEAAPPEPGCGGQPVSRGPQGAEGGCSPSISMPCLVWTQRRRRVGDPSQHEGGTGGFEMFPPQSRAEGPSFTHKAAPEQADAPGSLPT